jgi:hypothetical protein
MFKIIASVIITLFLGYMFWHFTHIWVTLPWPHHWGEVWANKTSLTPHLLLKCLSQTRKVNGDVFVLSVPIFPLSTIYLLNVWTVPTVVFIYWMFGLFWQCGIYLLKVGTVPTVWYLSIECLDCSDSVGFIYWMFGLFRQCGIYLMNVWTVPTVWDILFFISFKGVKYKSYNLCLFRNL